MVTKKRPGLLDEVQRLSKGTPKVVPYWARNPTPRMEMQQLVRVVMDFMKVRIACGNRADSPPSTNPAVIGADNLELILAVGAATGKFEDQIKKSLKYLLQQSEIGLWILDQPGLGSGWLGGFVLAEFPDIYDAGICNICGKYLQRQADMSFYHTEAPKKKDGSKSKNACEHDDTIMLPGMFRIHERKPSTFVRFAGLSTEIGYACPYCNYNLKYNSEKKGYTHPRYTNLPAGKKKCEYSNDKTLWKVGSDGVPQCAGLAAKEIRHSPPGKVKGKLNSFKSILRAKLIGPGGVSEAFLRAKHEKYYGIYAGYKNRIQQRDPWRSGKWIEHMAHRAMMYRFICDFFIKWRETEGLPVRPPYEEEKLGIVHHS